jgi:hypothetical protein
MNKCPNCEYHKESARIWRQKAYTLSGHPLNDEQEQGASMTDLRKAAEMALEALEDIKKYVTDDGAMPENWDAYHEKPYFALEALRQALAQPEQEPVAWVKKLNTMIIGCDDVIDEDGVHEDAKKLAKLVKKDCYEILQNLEEEKNGG